MSGQPFSFPPPPPPPPKRVEHQVGYIGRGRGRGGLDSSSGRGNFQNSRGRGNNSNRGRGSYGHNNQWATQPRPPSYAQSQHPGAPSSQHAPISHPVKRNHNTAFPQNHVRNTKPKAPPAVPSFHASLANLLPPKPLPTTKAVPTEKIGKAKNVFGLTPSAADASDSEDDDGEEARLAGSANGPNLEFSYEGQTSALRTPAEIAAWIAERKRRYPTQAKREAAKKEVDEQKKKWETEKQARAEALRATRNFREQQRDQRKAQQQKQIREKAPADSSAALSAAKLHAEKLRRRALKAQRDLEAAEAALKNGTPVLGTGDVSSGDDSLGTLSDSSQLESDGDTSSSESDTEDDRPPEQQSSKVEVRSAFTISGPASRRAKKPCNVFMKTGRCRYGTNCMYSHDSSAKSAGAKGPQPQSKPTRKGLFQVMVEQEEEEERRKVLSAIVSLGKQGLLEEPS